MKFDSIQQPKILIVDDSEMNRSILTDMLGDEYEIIEAEDGAEAIAALQKYGLGISLVLLDIVMPHMDGFEVLTVMDQKHWIEDIPVIVISAESGSDQMEQAYEMGGHGFYCPAIRQADCPPPGRQHYPAVCQAEKARRSFGRPNL